MTTVTAAPKPENYNTWMKTVLIDEKTETVKMTAKQLQLVIDSLNETRGQLLDMIASKAIGGEAKVILMKRVEEINELVNNINL